MYKCIYVYIYISIKCSSVALIRVFWGLMGQSWKTIVLVLAVVLMSVLMENVEEHNRKTFQNSSRNLKKKDINNEPKIVSKSFQKWSLGGPRGLPGESPGPLGGRSGVVRAPFAGCIGKCIFF